MSFSSLETARGSSPGHVGTYRRVLPVGLERMFENALDWEHLPHQHSASFLAIDCIDAGDHGWRAHVTNARDGSRSTIDLAFDRSRACWITRNLAGPAQGAEIRTLALPREDREIEVIVDFFVPGVAAAARDRVGAAYARAYATLYDEDEAMMVERQRQLDQRFERSGAPIDLGRVDRLDLPLEFPWRGRSWIVEEVAGALRVRAARCPHQLGPLMPDGGELLCPWHGYRFDAESGRCLTGQACRLPPPPRAVVEAGLLRILPPD